MREKIKSRVVMMRKMKTGEILVDELASYEALPERLDQEYIDCTTFIETILH